MSDPSKLKMGTARTMKCTIQVVFVWSSFILVTLFVWVWIRSPGYSHEMQADSKLDLLNASPEIVCTPTATKEAHVHTETKAKLILFYSFPYFYELEKSSGFEVFNSCSRKCELSVNNSRISEANIVIFYSHYQRNLPPVKQPGQIWVYFSVESPPYSDNSNFGRPQWHGLFNWTMTYRYDSELWHGYIRTVRRVKPADNETRISDRKVWSDAFSKKTKMVAWFVSHCDTDGKREKYVAELSKYIQVDIYGKCGPLKCERDAKVCSDMLHNDYKYYLSFENALCKDYVTEKLLQVFQTGMVIPVVRGGADYRLLFPNTSVIISSDFPSAKSLAKHLLALAADENEYSKYFQWTWDYEILGPNLPICQICERLNAPGPMSCVINNVNNWWAHRTCYPPTDL